MKKIKQLLSIVMFMTATLLFTSCSENFSNGERIGTITQFSETGIMWKSHEGHLNTTQTGTNSSVPFDFSIDNDNEPEGLVAKLDSAANNGYKVKLVYHQTKGWNWFSNRGETNHFITDCIILNKDFSNNSNTPLKQNVDSTGAYSTVPLNCNPITFNGLKNKDTIYFIQIQK